MRSTSTLVAVIADQAGEVVSRLPSDAANVTSEVVGKLPENWVESSALIRAAWDKAMRHRLIYTLVDFDPLAPVVSEWAHRLLGHDNELELAIGASNPPDPPDFYLVDEQLGTPLVNWYLGHLRGFSPGRVVPVRIDAGSISSALGSLGYGPPFPSGMELAATARDFVPLPGLTTTARTGVRLT